MISVIKFDPKVIIPRMIKIVAIKINTNLRLVTLFPLQYIAMVVFAVVDYGLNHYTI